MRKRAMLGLVLAIALAGAIPGASAASRTVKVRDDVFGPGTVTINVRSTIAWDWANGISHPHNVRQDRGLFRSGEPSAAATTAFTRVFSAGTFHYYCEVHGSPSGGMDGVIKVRPVVGAGPTGKPFRVVWAAASFETGSTFDVQYRIGGGSWRNWKRNTPSVAAAFGKNKKPIALKAGKTYSFRARSQEGGDDTTASGWSPVVSWTV